MDQPTVYCHPEIWDQRYLDGEGQFDRTPLAIPYTKPTVDGKTNVVEHRAPVVVAGRVYALGEIPRPHQDHLTGKVERQDGVVEDPIVDDQSVVVEMDDGLALVMGSRHAGSRSAVEHAGSVCDGTVRYIIGGTHRRSGFRENSRDSGLGGGTTGFTL